jgi:integrase
MARPNRFGVRGLYFDETTKQYKIEITWTVFAKDGRKERKRARESLPQGTSLTAGKHRARELLNACLDGRYDPSKPADKTLGEALDAYLVWAKTDRPKSYQSRESLAKTLRRVLGEGKRLDDIHPLDIERFKKARSEESNGRKGKVGPATINRAVAQLKHVVKLMAKWRWMSEERAHAICAVGMMTEPAERVRYLTPDEEARLFPALPSRVRDMFVVADLLGVRRSELAMLPKSAVNIARAEIKLTKTKSNRDRTIPIPSPAIPIIEAAISSSSCEYVFTVDGKRPYKPDSLTQAMARACKKAGITDLRLHDLRHDFATKVRRAGHGLDVIAKLLGHADVQTSARYAHVDAELLKAAVSTLAAPSFNPDIPPNENPSSGNPSNLRVLNGGAGRVPKH